MYDCCKKHSSALPKLTALYVLDSYALCIIYMTLLDVVDSTAFALRLNQIVIETVAHNKLESVVDNHIERQSYTFTPVCRGCRKSLVVNMKEAQ